MTAASRLDALRQELGERLSDRLFTQLSTHPAWADTAPRRHRSPSLLLALALAALVHAVGLVFALWGAVLLLSPWHHLGTPVGGVILLLMGWLARPRIESPPDLLLDPNDYPLLHELVHRLSQRLHTPRPAGIGVSTDFNSSYMTCGWRGERYVELGLPLLTVLEPAELTALLAHELAHGANGDPLRGKFLHGAIRTLAHWAEALRPTALGRAGEGHPFGPLLSLLSLPLEFAMLGISSLVLLFARGLLMLVLRDSQRAEYLADRLAARVVGGTAMTSCLEAMYLTDVVEAAARTHALTEPDAPLAPRLQAARTVVTPAQWLDWRDQSLAKKSRVDASHPPTVLRISLLATLDAAPPAPLLSDSETQALREEISRLLLKRQRYVVNVMLEAAYGG